MKYIFPLPKSPWPEGRVGPREQQDWYRAAIKAGRMQASAPDSKILLVSATKVEGTKGDLFYYGELFDRSAPHVVSIEAGLETVTQLGAAEWAAKKAEAKLVVISTWLHYPRVRWLCRGKNFEHHWVFGIPRLKEVKNDVLLIFLFPLIDILGLRAWFLRRVLERREGGKL